MAPHNQHRIEGNIYIVLSLIGGDPVPVFPAPTGPQMREEIARNGGQ